MSGPILSFSRFDADNAAAVEDLCIVHGLFGSSRNWQSLARRFAEHFNVIVPDLRNHGDSFHADVMDYPAMADDLLRLFDHLGVEQCHLLGHSMGGKAAMTLARQQPARLKKLVIADIAPVRYSHGYDHLLKPIQALDLEHFKSRREVDQALAVAIPDAGIRMFLLQNLAATPQGLAWKPNWPVLQRALAEIIGFDPLDGWRIDVPSLFLRGAQSDYVTAAAIETIRQHFTQARFATIDDAGHWLHAEQPVAFFEQVKAFLSRDA